jgi:transcriptional regulator with XRE-family HTH domain
MQTVSQATGIRLREARLTAGYSREQLAVRAGVASRTVTRVENGEDATMGTVAALAEVLGLTIVIIVADDAA